MPYQLLFVSVFMLERRCSHDAPEDVVVEFSALIDEKRLADVVQPVIQFEKVRSSDRFFRFRYVPQRMTDPGGWRPSAVRMYAVETLLDLLVQFVDRSVATQRFL